MSLDAVASTTTVERSDGSLVLGSLPPRVSAFEESGRLSLSYYNDELSVPFKWEAAPGKPMIQEVPNAKCTPLRPPPILLPNKPRAAAVNAGGVQSPHARSSSTAAQVLVGKMKHILNGKSPARSTTVSRTHSLKSGSEWFSLVGVDDHELIHNTVDFEGGLGPEDSSPVSVLNRSGIGSPACDSPRTDRPVLAAGGLNGGRRMMVARPGMSAYITELENSKTAALVSRGVEEDGLSDGDSAGSLSRELESSSNSRDSSFANYRPFPLPPAKGGRTLSRLLTRRASCSLVDSRRSDFDWPEVSDDEQQIPEDGEEGSSSFSSVRFDSTPSSSNSGSARLLRNLMITTKDSNSKPGSAVGSFRHPQDVDANDCDGNERRPVKGFLSCMLIGDQGERMQNERPKQFNDDNLHSRMGLDKVMDSKTAHEPFTARWPSERLRLHSQRILGAGVYPNHA